MFSKVISDQLKFYVYRLIDPRNGETIYVGKGRGNRVFDHAAGELPVTESDEAGSAKLARIRRIKLAGLEVQHVIHRHGLDSKTAYEVEAALIDAFPGLTNAIAGQGSDEFGAMHAKEIIRRYEAQDADFQHRVVLINVNRTAAENSLYDATRFAWKIDVRRAGRAEYVLPVVQGLIVGAFIAEQWLSATEENFEGREPMPGRFGFIGHPAPDQIQTEYVQKRVPATLRKKGASNPIKYAGPWPMQRREEQAMPS